MSATLVIEHFDVIEQRHRGVTIAGKPLGLSFFTVAKKLSISALSTQSPRRAFDTSSQHGLDLEQQGIVQDEAIKWVAPDLYNHPIKIATTEVPNTTIKKDSFFFQRRDGPAKGLTIFSKTFTAFKLDRYGVEDVDWGIVFNLEPFQMATTDKRELFQLAALHEFDWTGPSRQELWGGHYNHDLVCLSRHIAAQPHGERQGRCHVASGSSIAGTSWYFSYGGTRWRFTRDSR